MNTTKPNFNNKENRLIDCYEEALGKLDIETIYNHTSHQFKAARDKLRGGCPFHQSKSGTSFVVTPSNRLFWCPACNFGGSPADYHHSLRVGQWQKAKGKDFVATVKELAEEANVPFPEHEPSETEIAIAQKWERRRAVLEAATEYCQQVLWTDLGILARQYLTEVRSFSEEELKNLGLGYYHSTSSLVKALTARGISSDEIKEAGLNNRKWEGYITYPWLDAQKRPLTIYGRYHCSKLPDGDTRPKTLALPGISTKQSPLYFDRVKAAHHKEVVLVEGVNDAALLQVKGDTRVCAYVGASCSNAQIETLIRDRFEKIILCPDPDTGGNGGTKSNITRFTKAGISVYVAPTLPDGLDPDEFVIRSGIEVWKKHIEGAEHGFSWLAKDLISNNKSDSDLHKASLYQNAKALAKTLAVSELALVELSMFFWPLIKLILGEAVDENIFDEQQEKPNNGNKASSKNPSNSSSDRNQWNAPVAYKGELGWWVEEKIIDTEPESGEKIVITIPKFVAQTNFDFEVERELSDADGGGIVIQCQRSIDSYKKRVIVPSVDSVDVAKFTASLAKAYGSSIVCNLKKNALGALIHTKLVAYRERGGKTYSLADRHGQQFDGTWVFSDRQYTKDGEPTNEEYSAIVYNPNLGGTEDKMPEPNLAPEDPLALPRLVNAMRRFLGESNIELAIFVLGWMAAGVHYQEIQQKEGFFPLLNMVGEVGTGKSIIAKCALSIVGWQGKDGVLHRASVSSIYESLKMSGSLPLCLDDPERSRELDELLKGLFNAVPRRVRGNFQAPHAPLMITSNHALGDDHLATLSRLIQLYVYKSKDGEPSAWDDLTEAQSLASGSLPQLIKLGYPQQEIRPLRAELRLHLPLAHARVADSIGLILWYAMAVANLANFDTQRIKNFVINTLCATANNTNSAQDSLSDFIDKLNALQSMSKIGEWDIRQVESNQIGSALAIHLPSVWSQFDSTFHPTYSRKVIESLIEKQGGLIRATAQFHRSADESKAYYRYLTAPQHDEANAPSPPEMITRRCVLLPAHLASACSSPEIATDHQKIGDRLKPNVDEAISSVFSLTEKEVGDPSNQEGQVISSDLDSLDHQKIKDIYIDKNETGKTSPAQNSLNQAFLQSPIPIESKEAIASSQMPQTSSVKRLDGSPNCCDHNAINGDVVVISVEASHQITRNGERGVGNQSSVNSKQSSEKGTLNREVHPEENIKEHSALSADDCSLITEQSPHLKKGDKIKNQITGKEGIITGFSSGDRTASIEFANGEITRWYLYCLEKVEETDSSNQGLEVTETGTSSSNSGARNAADQLITDEDIQNIVSILFELPSCPEFIEFLALLPSSFINAAWDYIEQIKGSQVMNVLYQSIKALFADSESIWGTSECSI